LHRECGIGGRSVSTTQRAKQRELIAGLLHLGAIGVVDHSKSISGGRVAHRQNLTGADAKMAIRQEIAVSPAALVRPAPTKSLPRLRTG
jgi:hypothetical protein